MTNLVLAALAAVFAGLAAVFAFLSWRAKDANSDLTNSVSALKETAEKNSEKISRVEGALSPIADIPKTMVERLDAMRERMQTSLDNVAKRTGDSLGDLRNDFDSKFNTLQDRVRTTMTESKTSSEKKLEAMRESMDGSIGKFREELTKALADMNETIAKNFKEIREANDKKLNEMRETVEEKLQNTLSKRIGESFKQVSDQLQTVGKGLGEMQNLSANVGGLQKILSSAPSRGLLGEQVILKSILRQMLTPEQYRENVPINPKSDDRVEFAVNIPQSGGNILLPIDSKFPMEHYERYLEKLEQGDKKGAQASRQHLVKFVRKSAETINKKYICPPHSTDSAILFVPTEGLYGLLADEKGLFNSIGQEFHVMVAGPNTLEALLRTIQIGHHLFAVEAKVGEVRKVLGAVKTEFGKFGGVLEKAQKQLRTAVNTIDSAGTRTRQMQKVLTEVEALPQPDSEHLLGTTETPPD